MKDLLATLRDYDPGMLPALAELWGIADKRLRDDDIIPRLQQVMLDPGAVEALWDKLDEGARTALQLLVSSTGGRMKTSQFERFYGVIRKLGRAQISKEKPHQRAGSIAETLYYRGLIGEGFDKVGDSVVGFVYVPQDLIAALPLHKTSYQDLDESDAPLEEAPPTLGTVDVAGDYRSADTSIIDDLTTLLAYLQVNTVMLAGAGFAEDVAAELEPHLLRQDGNRLDFLLGMAASADLIAAQEGRAFPKRQDARGFLSAARSEQIRHLSGAWLESRSYRDLWHIGGLFPDDSGWSYDVSAARQAVMNLLGELLPEQGWVSINDLIAIIKEVEPDFQRPDGDYDSWYIRNAAGEFLKGFESWDAVEGSLIEFYLTGPMHWLGLVDIGEDVARLTAYGRAFLEFSDWPQPQEPPQAIAVNADGTLLASRRVNRFERFQLSRFANWLRSGDPYVYRLTAESIQRGAAQGIKAEHIGAFIERQLEGKPLPIALVKLLRDTRESDRESVSFESLIVLRATSEEALDRIFAMPIFRRHLGARLGPMACVVRDDQWDDLRAKLSEQGLDVDLARLRRDDGE